MVNRNSVEQIQIQVDKDVEAGLYDDITGAAIVAEAIELAGEVEPAAPTPTPPATPPPSEEEDLAPTSTEAEPTVSRMLTPEPAADPIIVPAPVPDEPSRVVAEEEVFDPIPTEAEIVQRVAQQRRETAEANLAPYLEFDPDGIKITGVRMDEAIAAGERPEDFIAMGINQAAIDAGVNRVEEQKAIEADAVLQSFLPTPTPRTVPRPGEELDVPADLEKAQKDAVLTARTM